jgi:hypothetical protein
MTETSELANAEPKTDGKAGARGCASAGSPETGTWPGDPLPDELWTSLLADPRAAGRPPLPIQQCRLSEIPRHVLRVECMRCFRIVEMQKLDAIRFYGPHAIWKDVG